MNTFGASMAEWSRDTSQATKRMLRGVSIALFTSVIRDTPVDTGRLRSNWRCSIGSPNYAEQDSVSSGGAVAVQEVMETASSLEGDQTIILTNNLPYAYKIEYEGWSKRKAPEGMVRKNMARINALLSRELRRSS